MKVVVTGANGQLGRELMRARWPRGTELVGWSSSELDITRADVVRARFEEIGPDVIVNAAAYTKVDLAEDEPDRARSVNATAVGNLATAADASDALLIHVSTDYVFDGSKEGWYVEDDPIAPLGVYGATKADGEKEALAARRSLVLRTAWVYGALGSNFVTTMLRLGAERDELGVVADQWGCPTSAADIAHAIVELVTIERSGGLEHRLFHVAAPDDTSWHRFATTIFELSSAGFSGSCNPLTTAEYPTRARRPANSRLATDRLAETLGHRLPPWRASLAAVISELEASGRG